MKTVVFLELIFLFLSLLKENKIKGKETITGSGKDDRQEFLEIE